MDTLAEKLRTATEPIYLLGGPGEREHVAVWKRTSSEWVISFLARGGPAGLRSRSRLKAASYAERLAAVPRDERLRVKYDTDA